MKFELIQPIKTTGRSVHGNYYKIRGTTPGCKWKIADVPFNHFNPPVDQGEARQWADLIVAAVNAINACAEPLGMDPVEFAKRLSEYPGVGLVVKYATDVVADIVHEVVHGTKVTLTPDGNLVSTFEKEGDVERKEEHTLQGEEGQNSTREDPEEGQG